MLASTISIAPREREERGEERRRREERRGKERRRE